MKALFQQKKIAMAVAMMAGLTMVGEAAAFNLIVGDQKWVLDGYSEFEDSSFTILGVPDGTSGNLWGIASVKEISTKSNPLGSYDTTVWSRGLTNNEYRTIRFGNIDLRFDGGAAGPAGPLSGYAITNGNPFALAYSSPFVFNHTAYFGNDNGVDNAIAGNIDTTAFGAAYAQVWATTGFNPATLANDLGTGPGAGTGALGTFGTLMATHGTSELLLDLVFAEGGILTSELNTGLGLPTGSVVTDVFRSVASSGSQNATLGFLDVIGGTQMINYDTNGFFNGVAIRPTGPGSVGFDIRFEASNSADTPDPMSPGIVAAGWDAGIESSSVTASAIPEPGVLGLLGIGLLGLGFAQKRRKA